MLPWYLAPILSKVTTATSCNPDWSMLLGICDKLHIRLANTLAMHKEETGRKLESSRYTSKKQMNLVFLICQHQPSSFHCKRPSPIYAPECFLLRASKGVVSNQLYYCPDHFWYPTLTLTELKACASLKRRHGWWDEGCQQPTHTPHTQVFFTANAKL